jgi:hypothetical protein
MTSLNLAGQGLHRAIEEEPRDSTKRQLANRPSAPGSAVAGVEEGPTSQTRPTSDSLTLAISSSMAEPSIVCGWMASRATPRSA